MKALNKVIKKTEDLKTESSKAEKEIENSLNKYLSKKTKVFVYNSVVMIKIDPSTILDKEKLKSCFKQLYFTYNKHFLIPIPKEIFSIQERKEIHSQGRRYFE